MPYKDKGWLRRQYVTKRRSLWDIARECGTHSTTIRAWVLKHGFPTRGLDESQRGTANGSWVESPIKKREVFVKEYVTHNRSLREIAAKYRLALRTVARWRVIHKVPRKEEKDFKRPRGSKHPCYRHGRGWKGSDCEDCGVPISTGHKLCLACRSRRYRGEGNPNYKGLADVMALVRQWVADNWTQKVFRKARYACQVCGDSKGGNLQAHHKRPLAHIVNAIIVRHGFNLSGSCGRLKAVSVIVRSRLVRSLRNGVALCKECHRDSHATGIRLSRKVSRKLRR